MIIILLLIVLAVHVYVWRDMRKNLKDSDVIFQLKNDIKQRNIQIQELTKGISPWYPVSDNIMPRMENVDSGCKWSKLLYVTVRTPTAYYVTKAYYTTSLDNPTPYWFSNNFKGNEVVVAWTTIYKPQPYRES